MSVSHTTAQVRAGTKTETRRLGWRNVKVGDTLTLCEKVMGRRRRCDERQHLPRACSLCHGTGYVTEPLVRIRDVRVTGVRRERLWSITDEGVRAEGLTRNDADFDEWYEPDGWPTTVAWVTWFCEAMGCRPDTEVTVIEWEYL